MPTITTSLPRSKTRAKAGSPGKISRACVSGRKGARIRTALQALRAERFHMKIHRETRMPPPPPDSSIPSHHQGYAAGGSALPVAKSRLKLTRVASDNLPNMRSDGRKLTAERWSMGRMADFLASQLSQPVTDQTQVEGIFHLKLEWIRRV